MRPTGIAADNPPNPQYWPAIIRRWGIIGESPRSARVLPFDNILLSCRQQRPVRWYHRQFHASLRITFVGRAQGWRWLRLTSRLPSLHLQFTSSEIISRRTKAHLRWPRRRGQGLLRRVARLRRHRGDERRPGSQAVHRGSGQRGRWSATVSCIPTPLVAPVTPGTGAAAPAVRSAVAGLRHTAEGTCGV